MITPGEDRAGPAPDGARAGRPGHVAGAGRAAGAGHGGGAGRAAGAGHGGGAGRAACARRAEVVVTGGGTAGHVLPAISVAEALVAIGYARRSIHFVGSTRGLESRLVPAAGFDLSILPGRGLVRRASLAHVVANLRALLEATVALAMAVALVARLRPKVVVMVGGYAGVPTSLAAWAFRVPVVVVNLDSVPGAANRLVGSFATTCAVAFEQTALPRGVLTGAPVRPEVVALAGDEKAKEHARARLGIAPGRLVLGVTTGSLGARSVNYAVPGALCQLAGIGGLLVYHVTGTRDHEEVLARARELGAVAAGSPGVQPEYRVIAYEDHLYDLLAACDVLVSRAGASTIAEIAALGVASILVPLPGAPGDHQRRNAETLERAGAAVLLDDAAVDSESLAKLARTMLENDDVRQEMSKRAAARGRLDAAAQIASLVDEAARRRPAASARPGSLEHER